MSDLLGRYELTRNELNRDKVTCNESGRDELRHRNTATAREDAGDCESRQLQ